MLRPASCALSISLSALAIVTGGCTTDHDALARKPNQAGAASGGTSGGGSGGSGGSGGHVSQGGRTNPDVEPAGDNVLTVLNGIVDAPSVRVCFASVGDDGETSELRGDPGPELSYATSLVLPEIDGFSFTGDVIQPWLIAGDFSLIKKLDCQAAVALAQSEEAKVTPDGDGEGGAASDVELEKPALRARALSALPAGSLDIGRSILMVLSGCLGGAAYSDVIDTEICGADYTPSSPTAQPIVVKLSREHGSLTIGLQALHASLPTGSVDVSATDGTTTLVFGSGLTVGAIEPRPADVRYRPDELGVTTRDWGLQAYGDQGTVDFDEAWTSVFDAAGVTPLAAGRTYTAVLLGPSPLVKKPGWWNQTAFSVVDNDPTRAQ